MSSTTKRKDGRKYKVDSGGINSLRRKYQIVMDSTMDSETLSFSNVPAIGSAHPSFNYLFVSSYDIEEGEGVAKQTLTVWVNYERSDVHVDGEGAQQTTCAVEHWGWDASTDQKELVTDADGNPVLNSAGDPFDSVPQISVYSPVFTKIVKFTTRQSSAMGCNCKVNSGAVTIGSMSCPEGSLLCSVEEERLIGDANWKYRYTIRLKYKTNKVKIAGANTLTDIGWDVAVTDAGMRELQNGMPVIITRPGKENGVPCAVTSPELLDGQGGAVARSASGTAAVPYNFRFKAYERTSIPSWFYTESDIREINA